MYGSNNFQENTWTILLDKHVRWIEITRHESFELLNSMNEQK